MTQVPEGRYRVHPWERGPYRDSRAGQERSGPRPGPREATQGLAPKAPSALPEPAVGAAQSSLVCRALDTT